VSGLARIVDPTPACKLQPGQTVKAGGYWRVVKDVRAKDGGSLSPPSGTVSVTFRDGWTLDLPADAEILVAE
jgi:hypothetical protein